MAVAVAQVGHGIGQAGYGAIRPHCVQPDRSDGHRPVSADPQGQHGRSDQVNVPCQWSRIKSQRSGVVLPLVTRELRAHPDDAVFTAVSAGVLWRTDSAFAFGSCFAAQTVRVQVPALQLVAVGRPQLVTDPASGNMRHRGARPTQVHDVGAKSRVLFNPGWLVFKPAVPPAQGFLQKADARLGHGEMRVLVRPRADDAFDRRLNTADQARYGIGVGIVPAANGQHRRVNGADVLAHRAVFPIGITVRVFQPGDGQQGLGLESRQPHLAPAVADQRRVWRA